MFRRLAHKSVEVLILLASSGKTYTVCNQYRPIVPRYFEQYVELRASSTTLILHLISACLAGCLWNLPFCNASMKGNYKTINWLWVHWKLYIVSHSEDPQKVGPVFVSETALLRSSPYGKVKDAASPANASGAFADRRMWIISTFLNCESSLIARSW